MACMCTHTNVSHHTPSACQPIWLGDNKLNSQQHVFFALRSQASQRNAHPSSSLPLFFFLLPTPPPLSPHTPPTVTLCLSCLTPKRPSKGTSPLKPKRSESECEVGLRLHVWEFEGSQKKPVQQVRKERALGMEGRREERGSGMEKGGGREDEMKWKINIYGQE